MKNKFIMTLLIAILVFTVGCGKEANSGLDVNQTSDEYNANTSIDVDTSDSNKSNEDDDFVERNITVLDVDGIVIKITGIRIDKSSAVAKIEFTNESEYEAELKYYTSYLNNLCQTSSIYDIELKAGESMNTEIDIANTYYDFVRAYGINSMDDVTSLDVSLSVDYDNKFITSDRYNVYSNAEKTFNRTIGEIAYTDDNFTLYYGGLREDQDNTLLMFLEAKDNSIEMGSNGFVMMNDVECLSHTYFNAEANCVNLGTITFKDKETYESLDINMLDKVNVPLWVVISKDGDSKEKYEITLELDKEYINK